MRVSVMKRLLVWLVALLFCAAVWASVACAVARAELPYDNSQPRSSQVYAEVTYNNPSSITATYGGPNRPIWTDSER